MESAQPEYRTLSGHRLKAPQLILSSENMLGSITPLVEYGEWMHIKHESGGAARKSNQLFGLILTPKDEVGEALCELEKRWRGSGISSATLTLNELLTYNEDLSQLLGSEIACEYDHIKLEEGLYPIDCSPSNLRRLTGERWPKDLDDLFDWHGASDIDRLFGHLSRWQIFLLGENKS